MKWFSSVVFLLFCFSVTVYPSRGDDMDNYSSSDAHLVDLMLKHFEEGLFKAAKTNYVEPMKNILPIHKDLLNKTDSEGRTLLHVAAMEGSVDVIKYLVAEQRVNVDVVNWVYNKITPLYEAVKAGKLEAVKLLIELGADKNMTFGINKSTLLHVAATGGNVEVLKYFLRYFNIDVRNIDSETPAFLAAGNGKLEALQFLLKNGADPYARTNNGNTLMQAAIGSGDVDVVRELTPYKQLINVPDYNNNFLPIEMVSNLQVAKELVDAGAIITNYSIYNYVYAKEFDIFKYLVIKSGKVNAIIHFTTPTGNNARDSGEPLLMILLDMEPLPYDMIKFILDQGADVNIKCCMKLTPLHKAAYYIKEHSLQIIKLLLEKGAEVNSQDLGGYTPLDYARERGNHDVIKYLQTFGAVTGDNIGKDALGSTTGHD